ncbi:hypothetical protein Tco_0454328 [Tanacetum coccineum]
MIDELSIVETDKVIHTVETDMVKLVVEIECFGKSFDEFDKEIGSSDGLLPKQADLSCVHALNEPHLHEIHVVPSRLRHDKEFYILDSRGAIPTKQADADAKTAIQEMDCIQEMAEYSQKWHNGTSRGRSTKTSDGLVAIQAQLNNLGREIKKVNEKVYAAQVRCEQCNGPHYTKDCP